MQSPLLLSRSRQRLASIASLIPQRHAKLTELEDGDAAITGLTRSLGRRLLGLNFSPRRQPAAAAAALESLKVA